MKLTNNHCFNVSEGKLGIVNEIQIKIPLSFSTGCDLVVCADGASSSLLEVIPVKEICNSHY